MQLLSFPCRWLFWGSVRCYESHAQTTVSTGAGVGVLIGHVCGKVGHIREGTSLIRSSTLPCKEEGEGFRECVPLLSKHVATPGPRNRGTPY